MAKGSFEEKLKNAKIFISKLLAIHPRTIKEIKDRLKKKGFNEKVINKAVDYFLNLGYLDDEKYINFWLENQIKYRPSSRAYFFQKLKDLGLNEDLINKVLNDKLNVEKEFEVALKISEKKICQLKNFPLKKQIEKLGRFLSRKGFEEEIIWRIIEKKLGKQKELE